MSSGGGKEKKKRKMGGAERVRLNKSRALEQEAASCVKLDQFLRKEVPSTSKANVS